MTSSERAPDGRRLLLAGSVGPERLPVRRDRDVADWFQPPHVRDETAARERIAAQVAAGADVVVAPTWLTHRRALLPLGETRRVAEWTAAAVRVARDAVGMGLERRDAALPEADDGVRPSRPAPLVAAALPALERAEQEDGHLLPRDAASERDYRDQAGVLADAAPDLILVEGQRQDEEARVAMAIAAEAGLPVWISLETECLAGVDLEEWLDYARSSGVSRVLVPPPLAERDAAIDGAMAWGGVRIAPDAVAEWLAAGAGVIGRLDGATVAQLEPLRAAIDAHEGEVVAQVRATEQRLSAAVADAAAMAPGGTAVWIGQRTSDALPSHFAWLTVVEDEIRQLPDGHFRLVVVSGVLTGPGGARLLDRGGILVQPWNEAVGATPGLRILSVDDVAAPALAICRRED